MRAKVTIAATLLATAVTADARADLRDIVSRVSDQWRLAGAGVSMGDTRFLYEDETMTVIVPPGPAVGCTTVALVGARGLSFHAKVSGTDDDPLAEDPTSRATSLAGVLQIERCEGPPIRHLVVTSDAGRGAIEAVIAHSKGPVPSLRVVLPERTGGLLPPAAEPGILPPLATPQKRAEGAEARARLDGGQIAPREAWHAANDGNGEAPLALDEGCHRIELFANDPRAERVGRRSRLDLDAELRSEEDDAVLAKDRTEASDARLEVCVGERTVTNVLFAGSPPDADVTVTHASWPIPAKLPTLWGPAARAKMAKVILARHVASPSASAVGLAQGGSGTTSVPVTLEPGGCYLAVSAVTHGHARGLGMRAILGAREMEDERGPLEDAGVVAFCAREDARARLEVDARGSGIAWGLALFRIGSGIWQVGR